MTLVTIGNPNPLNESEDLVLLSAAIRHDLRRLMSFGRCHYEISRKLYEAFKDAHGGRSPEDMQYAVNNDHYLKLLPSSGEPHGFRVSGWEVDAGCFWDGERKQFDYFDTGESVGGSAMLELTRWLDTPEGHAVTGWFSFGEWRGNQTIKKDLAALRGPRF
jgi:hypothetical protein